MSLMTMSAITFRLRSHTAAGILLSALVLAGMPSLSHAQLQCTITSSATSISFDAVSTPRDTPIGGVLSNVGMNSNSVRCPANPGTTGQANAGFYLQLVSQSRASSTVPGVWETGTPGIGVRVISLDYAGGHVLSHVDSGKKDDFGPRVALTSPYTGTFRFSFQLIKTGQVTGTGQINVGSMYYLISHNIPANTPSPAQVTMALAPTPFTARTCTVSTRAVTVDLPPMAARSLAAADGSQSSTPFRIELRCDQNFNVFVTMTDATTPANRTDTLTLAANSTARGVGVRMRDPNSAPVLLGPDSPVAGNTNQWLVGPATDTMTILMTAEYVATGTVEPGIVRALATFTMSYQ